MKKTKRLPKFRSVEEEAAYWDSHSATGHLREFRPAEDVRFIRPEKRLMSMRYDVELLRKIRFIAARKGTPYQTLMHQWLTERANAELDQIIPPPRPRKGRTLNVIPRGHERSAHEHRATR